MAGVISGLGLWGCEASAGKALNRINRLSQFHGF
jgi:hypothetical protein